MKYKLIGGAGVQCSQFYLEGKDFPHLMIPEHGSTTFFTSLNENLIRYNKRPTKHHQVISNHQIHELDGEPRALVR